MMHSPRSPFGSDRFRRWSVGLALGASLLVTPGAAGVAAAQSAASMAQGDIVDTAVGAGQFTTLATALEAAGLTETLKGPGPYTIFAPTDQAFAKLPAGTLEALLNDPDELKAVLSYHVVAGKVTAADASALQQAATVEGENLTINASDGMVQINDAAVTQADVMASNGVIHVIDTVLLPPSLAAAQESTPDAAAQ